MHQEKSGAESNRKPAEKQAIFLAAKLLRDAKTLRESICGAKLVTQNPSRSQFVASVFELTSTGSDHRRVCSQACGGVCVLQQAQAPWAE